jgi:NADH:ubiquinone oxidoreductase subunit 5 (subunit L)/multisubunit Na+/H+ antiporter MnhA subunit
MTAASLVILAPCSLLAGAALELLLARLLSARAKGVIALLSCLPSLLAVLATGPFIRGGGAIDFSVLPLDGPLALVFHVDALSVLFAFMGTAIGAVVLLYSIDYMAEDQSATRFYVVMLTFISGLVGVVYSANLFFLYLCWEVVGLCSFLLVGFWYKNQESVRGARKVLLMTHLAGYGLLAAVLVVYARTGSTLWTDPAVAKAFTGAVFLLMLVSLAAKSVQFPLHTWIPEAMAAPTPVSALLHSACYVTAGVYLAARMHSFGPWAPSWGITMVWVGTVTMAVGVMYAMVQHDMKRMLAFSTVSQIGYMIAGIGIGSPLGIAAGLLHCLNHGFFKGGLFLVAGSVQHATGTRDMDKLGGLASKMPRTTLVWLISAGSMMGIPLMSGFVSKWLLYTAALEQGLIVPAMAAWVVSVGTIFVCVKASNSVFFGNATEATEHAHEAPHSMVWGLGLIATASLVLGVAPQIAFHYLLNPVLLALGLTPSMQITWFGLAGAGASWFITGGLVLATASVAVGALVYMLANVARGTTRVVVSGGGGAAMMGGGDGGVFTGGEMLPGSGRLPASDFSAVLKKHWGGFFQWSDVDRIYLGVWDVLESTSKSLRHLLERAQDHAAGCAVGVVAVTLVSWRWLLHGITPIASEGPLAQLPLGLILSCGLACLALSISTLTIPKWRSLAPLMLLSGWLAVAGMGVSNPTLRLALLETASLLILPVVWRACDKCAAAWVYSAVVVGAAVSLVGGHLLLEHGSLEWAKALLICGILIKFAILPTLLWLPKIAARLPALVMGLIIAVIDIAVLGEFSTLVKASPWLVSPHGVWLATAIGFALGSSFLMLGQSNLKRLLILSTIEDTGFLMLGLLSGSELGSYGALLGASVHAAAKALLFICLSAPEADGELGQGATGLASTYPVSACGFLLGLLAMLGVPPTLGFAARWRLYETALHAGPWVLVAFVLSSMFALISYVRVLCKMWWGPTGAREKSSHEPLLLAVVIVGVMVALLVAGAGATAFPVVIWGTR